MLTCPGCGTTVPPYFLGPWCDTCGGIMARPGVLLLRHVATVDGPGGRFPIVFDRSCDDYSCSIPKAPRPEAQMKLRDEDGFKRPRITTYRGSLDLVIAMMQPIARGPKGPDGEAPPMPELSAAPFATDEEKALLAV